jgi:hypothetical protein
MISEIGRVVGAVGAIGAVGARRWNGSPARQTDRRRAAATMPCSPTSCYARRFLGVGDRSQRLTDRRGANAVIRGRGATASRTTRGREGRQISDQRARRHHPRTRAERARGRRRRRSTTVCRGATMISPRSRYSPALCCAQADPHGWSGAVRSLRLDLRDTGTRSVRETARRPVTGAPRRTSLARAPHSQPFARADPASGIFICPDRRGRVAPQPERSNGTVTRRHARSMRCAPMGTSRWTARARPSS